MPRGEQGARGERRIVTALFCDVANSTALAGELDPEEWVEQIDDAFGYIIDAVERYEGTVARLLGDAVLAFFGAPLAHEDDPERAVLAGLEMIQDIRPFQARFRREFGMAFDIRVGINTGEVVFGTLAAGGDEFTAMGDAVNIAARMQQMAQPNSVQISAVTYGMVSTLFEVEPLGDIEVKGKRDAMTAYRVLRYQPPTRTAVGIRADAVPLVGRDAEMDAIRQAVDRFRNGHGHALIISGETGLGKTRLIDEIHHLCMTGEASDAHWSEARGISYDTRRPYGVVQRLLRRDMRVSDATPASSIETSVARRAHDIVGQSDPNLERVIQTLVSGTPEGDGPPVATEDFQRAVFQSVERFYRTLASQSGLVLVIDDLHWADAASTDLLTHLLPLIEETRTLLVCAFRHEQPSTAWTVKTRIKSDLPDHVSNLELQPLLETHSAQLLDALLNGAHTPESLRAMILQKTGGNPLFVEAVVRALADQSIQDAEQEQGLNQFVIPDSLHALLTAQIDNLDREARHLLQFASVIGRTFSATMLEQVTPERDILDEQLETLERAGIIEETQRVPEHHFGFRHELMRDVVYRSMLRRDRRRFHRQVAEFLDALPNAGEEHPYQLAQHYRQAGDLQRALHYTARSAARARDLYANTEAITLYSDAIALSLDLDAPELDRAKMLIARAALLVIHGNFDRAQEDYESALDLARRVADRETEWSALEGLGVLWFGRDYDRAGIYLQEALSLAQEIGDKQKLARSLLQIGQVHGMTDLDEARTSLESARDLFIEIGDRRGLAETMNQISLFVYMATDAIAFVGGIRQTADLFRELGSREGLAYALTAFTFARSQVFNRTLVASQDVTVDATLAANDEALAIMNELGGWPAGEAWASGVRAMTLHAAGHSGEAIDLLSRTITISEQFDLTETESIGHLWTGLIYRDLCLDDLASSHLQAGYDAAIRGGAGVWIPQATSDLAECYVRSRDLDRAATLLESVTPETPMRTSVDRQLWLARAQLDIARGDNGAAIAIIDRLYENTPHVTAPRDIPALAEVRGIARMRAGHADAALRDLDEALAGAIDQSYPIDVWRIQARRARALDQVGDAARASEARSDASRIVDDIASEIPDETIRSRFVANAMAFIAGGES